MSSGAEVVITGDADLFADDAVRAWLARRDIEVTTAVDALRRITRPEP